VFRYTPAQGVETCCDRCRALAGRGRLAQVVQRDESPRAGAWSCHCCCCNRVCCNPSMLTSMRAPSGAAPSDAAPSGASANALYSCPRTPRSGVAERRAARAASTSRTRRASRECALPTSSPSSEIRPIWAKSTGVLHWVAPIGAAQSGASALYSSPQA
jgi:hypothetical protein